MSEMKYGQMREMRRKGEIYTNVILKTLFTTDPLGAQGPAHQHNNTSRVGRSCSRAFLILLEPPY